MNPEQPTIHLDKKGLRVLGIAESFYKEKGEKSVLAGVVIRADKNIIDGFSFTKITVGGDGCNRRSSKNLGTTK